jgi:hypothetical protein
VTWFKAPQNFERQFTQVYARPNSTSKHMFGNLGHSLKNGVWESTLLFSSILFKEKMENLGCDPACRSDWGGGDLDSTVGGGEGSSGRKAWGPCEAVVYCGPRRLS